MRHPNDVLYNAREGVYDPRTALQLQPVDFAAADEPSMLLVPVAQLRRRGGPASRALATTIIDHAPANERDRLLFTVRAQTITPGSVPSGAIGWHTDYAKGALSARARQRVHSYMIVSGPPLPAFIAESDIWLPDTRRISGPHNFTEAYYAAELTTLHSEAWTLLRFNATELHTSTPLSDDVAPTPRLFIRATFDSRRH